MSTEAAPITPSNPVYQEVIADLQDVPFREPIVDDYGHLAGIFTLEEPEVQARRIIDLDTAIGVRDNKTDRQWMAVTEAARRAILQNPNVRHSIAAFSAQPLSEALPGQALNVLAKEDDRIGRLANLTGKTLGSLLDLEPVPDDLMVPDIRHAPNLIRIEDEAKLLARYKRDTPENYQGILHTTKERVRKNPGITKTEGKLVARRYRYARDVKMLGLMAELYDKPFEGAHSEDGIVRHELASGTKLAMTEEAYEATPALLDPQAWESRKQLKDRVYVVTIGGKPYIMKERKTPRHTDVMKSGHVDGLTSEQEFATARDFAALGTIRQDDIELSWEQPLGYVEFPDGYQFCLFSSEPGLSTYTPRYRLADEILARPEEYSREYVEVAQRAKNLYEQKPDLASDLVEEEALTRGRASSSGRHDKLMDQRTTPEPDQLSFEEFANIKASLEVQAATDLLSKTMLEEGYINSDWDGFGYRIRANKRPIIEIVGFDFEYYKKDPSAAAQKKQQLLEQQADGSGAYTRLYFESNRPIVRMASYAMLARMGYKLPPSPGPHTPEH